MIGTDALAGAAAIGIGVSLQDESMLKHYQDHDGTGEATSDSRRKLNRLHMPDMTGKTFLDIGSNEGFFLNAALQRGAVKAVGIDREERRLDFCRATIRIRASSCIVRHGTRCRAVPSTSFCNQTAQVDSELEDSKG